MNIITLMLAEVATVFDASAITPVVSAIGSLGFAIWFAYHATTVTLPRQQQEHREALKELASIHASTIKELVAEMRAERESFDRWRSSWGTGGGSNH